MQHQATKKLHVEVPKLQDPPHGLTEDRKGLVNCLRLEALCLNTLLQLHHLGAESVVVHLFELLLQLVNCFYLFGQGLNQRFIFLLHVPLDLLLRLFHHSGLRPHSHGGGPGLWTPLHSSTRGQN